MDPLHEQIRADFASAPFIAELGIALIALGEGSAEAALPIARRHTQREGYVHAGVQCALADHTAAAAAATLAPEGATVLSVEFKLNLLRPAQGERLRCFARVLKPGRTLAVVEAEVYAPRGDGEVMTSKLTATMAIVPRR